MQPEEVSEGELTDVNNESGCDEKTADVSKGVTSESTSHERSSWRYFATLKAQRIKW